MASIDDILNNPAGQSFSLDPGTTIAEVIRALEAIQTYNISILKNQARILQYLKDGRVDEEAATDYVVELLARLDEEIGKDYTETMMRIIAASKK